MMLRLGLAITIDLVLVVGATVCSVAYAQDSQPALSRPSALGPAYISSANNADKLQLNSDSSFSLQEGGRSFTGNYSVAGATLKLHIVELQKDVDILVQGSELVVNGEEIWTQPNKVSESSVTVPSTAAEGLDLNLASLENDIEAGKEVNFKIKYNQIGPGDRQTTYISYSPEAYVAMAYMRDGVLTLSKTAFAFSGDCRINRGFGRVEHCDFRASPGKILELENQPEQSSRIHVKVAIKNAKGDKEDKKDYYFYNAGASAIDGTADGRPSVSIICDGCDDSMNTLYALLQRVRGKG